MSDSVRLTAGDGIAPVRDSARALFWRLVLLYNYGCFVAIAITFGLAILGLEMTAYQWLLFMLQVPVAVAIYTTIDVAVISRHFDPIRKGLRALDAGGTPDQAVISSALVRAINLPYLSFLRVTFIHGPIASVLTLICTVGTDPWIGAGFTMWQGLAFAMMVMFFASPTHAIFEYFAVSREMLPHIFRFTRTLGGSLPAEYQKELVAVRLKSKLLYLAIFVTTLPLVFFAFTVVFKIERLFATQGLTADFSTMLSLYSWIAGIVLVCMAGAITMALLTANEVSRSATRLIDAMQQVEAGRLDNINLDVVSTDEYGDIYRGFQLMLESLREEQRILAISQDLAGELQLDVLIARIMHAATDLLGAERSTLFIHDPRTNELFSFYAEGDRVREIRIPADRGIAGAVFASGELENIADAYGDPRFVPGIDKETGFKTRSILCAPISNKAGGRIGVTQVLNKKVGGFTLKDEARLRAFSAQIAVCLENARLFEDVLYMKNYNESILQSTSNGIVTLDGDNRVVTANDASLKMLGLQGDALLGREGTEVFAGGNAWIADNLERTRKTAKMNLAVDAEVARPDGGISTVNLTTAPLIDAADKQIGSMLVLEDITSEKRVRSTMARYMSKEVADQLLQSGEDELVGKDQRVSILFSDVRGFTTIAESASARETVAMLNEYFTDMVDVIFAHGGILDKYIGDAIMALFGAPFAGPNDATNAIATANRMMIALRTLNGRRSRAGRQPLDIGLGISTGDVVVGNIGSAKRMEYTVIGDSVNLASRLEGANKFYGTKILFSEFTMAELTNPSRVREIDMVRVKGKDKAVRIYETLAWRSAETEIGGEELMAAYIAGRAAFAARNWREAAGAFEAALVANPGDGPSKLHLERARAFIDQPPADDWDGAWTLASK